MLACYTDRLSVRPGERFGLHASAARGPCAVRIARVGQGRQESAWIGEILAAKDRRQGSVVAPAHGLTLWRVGFPGDALVDE